MNLPPVVSAERMAGRTHELLAKEKERPGRETRWPRSAAGCRWCGSTRTTSSRARDGKATLLDLFEGRRQLLLYHFMFGPNQDVGCDGCSMFVDQVGHLAHLHARDTSFVLVSRAPLAKIEPYKRRMGWTIPWYSSFESDFNVDFGVSPETPQPDVYQDGETFGLSVFLRDGDDVFRTYFTTSAESRRSAASGRSST